MLLYTAVLWLSITRGVVQATLIKARPSPLLSVVESLYPGEELSADNLPLLTSQKLKKLGDFLLWWDW